VKFLLSFVLVIGSLVGIMVCFMSDITVDSSLGMFNGLDVSLGLGIFFVAVFLGGLSLLFSRDTL
jgi:hypothetical protein